MSRPFIISMHVAIVKSLEHANSLAKRGPHVTVPLGHNAEAVVLVVFGAGFDPVLE
jgi:hypothetical protein